MGLGGDWYYNPDLLYCLIGPVNKMGVKVEGQNMQVLFDLDTQISALSESMVKILGLEFM